MTTLNFLTNLIPQLKLGFSIKKSQLSPESFKLLVHLIETGYIKALKTGHVNGNTEYLNISLTHEAYEYIKTHENNKAEECNV
ncbi:hypothetical protein H5119_16280 [Pseudoalteromonas sp. SG45-5]|uniref:hypothetical protein n=1 Tax=unclassified Pseudoalteromonas TaxID=194690 RepID=UPI0015F7BE07|nr:MULTISPECIES: hypothetical protein [unclassified Pseudoalteromonas]MBB1387079.1 hypothetical protein [Pseudoalteromonas sp. SG45-5]MBB1395163.1 hypothetical protein [Pseudoalteromonas sp. SG44-4]MBB1447814.1 hypothetical protein [Pseudoalteromonas sp. SG41-6]